MLNIITSQNPDIKPAVPAQPQLEYPYPSISDLKISRPNINTNPHVAVQLRNFRLVTDENGDPVYLDDGITQAAQYGPRIRTRNISDLYAWIAQQANAAEIVTALNTLLAAVINYDEELKAAELASSSSSSSV